jgi:hypothetical protein
MCFELLQAIRPNACTKILRIRTQLLCESRQALIDLDDEIQNVETHVRFLQLFRRVPIRNDHKRADDE